MLDHISRTVNRLFKKKPSTVIKLNPTEFQTLLQTESIAVPARHERHVSPRNKYCIQCLYDHCDAAVIKDDDGTLRFELKR